MKAIGLYKYLPIDHPESLLDVEIPKPIVMGKDLLVKVKAISVNPVDTIVRSPGSEVEDVLKILGWDIAGVVDEVGPDCTMFKSGDEVYYAGSITRQGGNSEYHLVDERIVGKKPRTLDFAQSAALPLTTITAYESLFYRLQISHDVKQNKNKTILIIGAAGGVGSIAIQLAKLAGLTVIGTTSRPETSKWSKDLGADYTINHYQEFTQQLKELGLNTVDYILCLSKTEKYWETMEKIIIPQGKICSIVETNENLNITLMKDKSVTFVWEMVFTRSMYETNDIIEQHYLLNKVADLIDQGKIRTTLSERLSPINAENLKKAHKKLESRTTIGKIVLENF